MSTSPRVYPGLVLLPLSMRLVYVLAFAALLVGCGRDERPGAPRVLYRASAMSAVQDRGRAEPETAEAPAAARFDAVRPAEQDDLAALAQERAREQEAEIDRVTAEYMGSTGDLDCRDFAGHGEAQAFYEAHGPGDRHMLDADRDGVACESLR